jgi:hypothetical protein
MGTETMGKVIVTAKIDNIDDLDRADRGEISLDQVRSVTVTNALLDTGAATLDPGSPPAFELQPLGENRFRLLG